MQRRGRKALVVCTGRRTSQMRRGDCCMKRWRRMRGLLCMDTNKRPTCISHLQDGGTHEAKQRSPRTRRVKGAMVRLVPADKTPVLVRLTEHFHPASLTNAGLHQFMRATLRHLQHDLADVRGGFHELVRVNNFFQRKCLMNHRFHFSRREQRPDLFLQRHRNRRLLVIRSRAQG